MGNKEAIGVNKIRSGQCAHAVGYGGIGIRIVKDRKSEPLFSHIGGRAFEGFPSTGHIDHNESDLLTPCLIGFLKNAHFTLAGTAPAGPEVQHNRRTGEIGQLYGVAIKVICGEIRRSDRLRFCAAVLWRGRGAQCAAGGCQPGVQQRSAEKQGSQEQNEPNCFMLFQESFPLLR